jgi:hypothetical protein
MQSYYAIETEAAFRRREWERAVAAEKLAAQVNHENGKIRWTHLPQLSLARLRALSAPRLPFTSALEPDCPTPA